MLSIVFAMCGNKHVCLVLGDTLVEICEVKIKIWFDNVRLRLRWSDDAFIVKVDSLFLKYHKLQSLQAHCGNTFIEIITLEQSINGSIWS